MGLEKSPYCYLGYSHNRSILFPLLKDGYVLLKWETLLSHTHKKGEKPGPSLILMPSPFFVLQFAFSIILGGGRAAKNRLGLGTLIM